MKVASQGLQAFNSKQDGSFKFVLMEQKSAVDGVIAAKEAQEKAREFIAKSHAEKTRLGLEDIPLAYMSPQRAKPHVKTLGLKKA